MVSLLLGIQYSVLASKQQLSRLLIQLRPQGQAFARLLAIVLKQRMTASECHEDWWVVLSEPGMLLSMGRI